MAGAYLGASRRPGLRLLRLWAARTVPDGEGQQRRGPGPSTHKFSKRYAQVINRSFYPTNGFSLLFKKQSKNT